MKIIKTAVACVTALSATALTACDEETIDLILGIVSVVAGDDDTEVAVEVDI